MTKQTILTGIGLCILIVGTFLVSGCVREKSEPRSEDFVGEWDCSSFTTVEKEFGLEYKDYIPKKLPKNHLWLNFKIEYYFNWIAQEEFEELLLKINKSVVCKEIVITQFTTDHQLYSDPRSMRLYGRNLCYGEGSIREADKWLYFEEHKEVCCIISNPGYCSHYNRYYKTYEGECVCK